MTVLHETPECDRQRNALRAERLARMSPPPKPAVIIPIKPRGVKTTPPPAPPPPAAPIQEELRAKARDAAICRVIEETPKPTIRAIQAATCLHFRISYHDLVSHRRHKDEVIPRQIAMYLSRIWSGKALPEIGFRFGHRDHTTVLHSYRRVLGWIASNHANIADLDAIEGMLDLLRAPVPPPTNLPHNKTRSEHSGSSA